jgi:hypothetical protein
LPRSSWLHTSWFGATVGRTCSHNQRLKLTSGGRCHGSCAARSLADC